MELSGRAAEARPVNAASVPAHLLCKACSNPLINCLQTHCGFRLCRSCAIAKLHPSVATRCPGSTDEDDATERMASLTTCLPDTATRRELSELMVHCPNAGTGCEEQLKWKHVDFHLRDKCEFEMVNCEWCSQAVVQCKLQTCHRNLQSADCCPAFSAFHCPLCRDSSRWLNRSEFVEHRETCPDGPVECKYRWIGCQEMMKRKDRMGHYSCRTDAHLELAVKLLQAENMQKDEKLREMEARLTQLEKREEETNEAVRRKDEAAEKRASISKDLQNRKEKTERTTVRKLENNENVPGEDKIQLRRSNTGGHARQRSLPSAKLLAANADRLAAVLKPIDITSQQVRNSHGEDVTDVRLRLQSLENWADVPRMSAPCQLEGRKSDCGQSMSENTQKEARNSSGRRVGSSAGDDRNEVESESGAGAQTIQLRHVVPKTAPFVPCAIKRRGSVM